MLVSMHNITEGERETTPFDSIAFTSFLVEAKRNARPVPNLAMIQGILPAHRSFNIRAAYSLIRTLFSGLSVSPARRRYTMTTAPCGAWATTAAW